MPLAVACGDPTDPAPPRLEPNTMVVRVTGGREFDGTIKSLGGFQRVTTGAGSGVHLQGEGVGGLPLVIHLPGRPAPGTYRLGRWDPTTDFVRQGGVLNVGRKPSLSFGDTPAVALGQYASLDGGTLEIDAVTIPDDRAFFETGSIRGRLRARAVTDARMVVPGVAFRPDTVDIRAEFRVDLENWPDGRATVSFSAGPLASIPAAVLVGSGSRYFYGGLATPPRLVIGLAVMPPESDDSIQLWFGTRLRGPGRVELGPMGVDHVFDASGWVNDFAAGRVAGRSLESVSGTLDLEAYEEEQPPGVEGGDIRWGEAKGRLVVNFGDAGPGGIPDGRSSAVIAFHVPVGFIFQVVSGPSAGASAGAPPDAIPYRGAAARYPNLVVPRAQPNWMRNR